MATLGDLGIGGNSSSSDDDDIGVIRSTLSGIASGVFKIPEGFFSLGANLIDLGLNTNTAASVEKFFDTINPFDEAAEATAAGRIAELIVNIGVPGGIAFKAGKNLTKAALAAKQNGNYYTLTGTGLADDVISKGVPKATKWNVAPINKEVQELALNKKGKFLEYAGGAGLGGVAEGVFVGDVDKAGTLGDFLGGPTKLDRETGGSGRTQAGRDLANRLKFGVEGGLFTAGIGLGGVGFNRLRKGPTDTGRVITDPMEKFWNNLFGNLSKRGKKGTVTFEATDAIRTGVDANKRLGLDAANTIENQLYRLYPKMEKYWASDDGIKELAKKKEALNKTLLDGLENPIYETKQLTRKGKESGFTLDEVMAGRTQDGKIIDDAASLMEDGFTLKFGNVTDDAFESFSKELDNSKSYGKGAPVDEVKESIRFEMNLLRNKWADLFSSYGRMLTPKELANFKNSAGSKMKDFIDAGSKIFKDKTSSINALEKLPVTSPIIKKFAAEIDRAAQTYGVNLTPDEINGIIRDTYNSAVLEKGFNLNQNSGIFFRNTPKILGQGENTLLSAFQREGETARKYFREGLSQPVEKGRNLSQIDDITLPDGSVFERKKLLKELVGKSNDGLNTAITGTNRIANLVIRGEVNQEIIRNSARQKKLVDDWLKSVDEIGEAATIEKSGPRPKAPEIVDTAEDAKKYFGGERGQMGSKGQKSTGDYVEMVAREDPTPIKGIRPLTVTDGEIKSLGADLTNNLNGKFALTGNADALVKGDIVQESSNLGYLLYKNAILYPKAGAQLAKTVLGPVTHARNFLSAMAFAGANGVLLNNEFGALKKAWNSSMGPAFGGKATTESKAFYRKLLDLGVVNSNVSQGDLNRLLSDVKFGETIGKLEGKTINNIVNLMSRGKKFAQDAYTAEDDFWKIFSWIGEKTRLEKGLREIPNEKGLAFGDDVIEVLDDGTTRKLGEFNEEFLEKRAADLVKNNVPNYAYVSDFVQGLRKYPVGNFVSFPAEIMRTSTNIVETALKEINFKIQLPSGAIVQPFKSIGKQRLRGMALTTAVVPASIATGAAMLYDVTKDEIEALRRYVPKWSKNSTLIPIRNEDGKLSYIDFSRMNAYDLLLKPIQGVINSIDAGRTDNNGIMADFIKGLAEGTKEIASPFITSSLWVEALQDVLPTAILGRGGLDAEGRRVYNESDSAGNKIMARMMHLIDAVAPFNASQMNRLFKASMPEGTALSYDKYGKDYKLGKELSGLVGLRAVDVDPEKGIKYKINEYQKNVRNARSLFTSKILKGGPVSPEEVVDAYINANRAMYETNKIMYRDIEAAKTLGMTSTGVETSMDERGAGSAYDYLESGTFKPYTVSEAVAQVFQHNADMLGVANPLDAAGPVLDRIAEILESIPMGEDIFPDLDNPFSVSLGEAAGNIYNAVIPPQVNNNFLGAANVNLNQVQGVTPNFAQLKTQDQKLQRISNVNSLIKT
jgi:hypothetical protein